MYLGTLIQSLETPYDGIFKIFVLFLRHSPIGRTVGNDFLKGLYDGWGILGFGKAA
jgi:hypothetical protein